MNGKYSRQELFSPIGNAGQKKIREASIFVMGAGALGSSSAEMLVRAGIGRITIVDRDIIEWTNLHRQQLYTEQDVVDQLPKAVAAARRLSAINSDVAINGIVADVTSQNILELIDGHTAVLDATDNIEIRLLMNDATLKLDIPFFMGACVGSYGLTFPIGIEEGQPCLHCMLETLPAQSLTCDTVGVISPIVVTTAARQVTDALKFLIGALFNPKLESIDLWTGDRASIGVKSLKKANCPSCSENPVYPFLSARESLRTAVLCGRDTVQLTWPSSRRFELASFAESIRGIVSKLIHNPHLVACEYAGHRIVLFRDGRMLIHGTKDIMAAKRIAAGLLG
ncbi:ThiF family adenylyltransferase [Sporosarcina limicola]|uniref:Molybdopterin/thiamine biosynthesis adenylyltransferase n=1 Tax=Sporosarcina limicola TaxID=34101 RepID=A0A927MFR6_9BACL|nr:ThiF family adenylyltransferase [Sporosarcina limicola]MBE1553018.1 molybdopterin/thiamine biosynthesis adenylyltransferase [Sporosarcina limicola]